MLFSQYVISKVRALCSIARFGRFLQLDIDIVYLKALRSFGKFGSNTPMAEPTRTPDMSADLHQFPNANLATIAFELWKLQG